MQILEHIGSLSFRFKAMPTQRGKVLQGIKNFEFMYLDRPSQIDARSRLETVNPYSSGFQWVKGYYLLQCKVMVFMTEL